MIKLFNMKTILNITELRSSDAYTKTKVETNVRRDSYMWVCVIYKTPLSRVPEVKVLVMLSPTSYANSLLQYGCPLKLIKEPSDSQENPKKVNQIRTTHLH